MQNEFEKQVKQKMEELDFVPAAPVWKKIEEQIRQKKERKRIIFWLPFTLLFIGGGITWFILTKDQPAPVAQGKNIPQSNIKSNPAMQTSAGKAIPANADPENKIVNQDQYVATHHHQETMDRIPGLKNEPNDAGVNTEDDQIRVSQASLIPGQRNQNTKQEELLVKDALVDETVSSTVNIPANELVTEGGIRSFGTYALEIRPVLNILHTPVIKVDGSTSVIPLSGKTDSNAIVSMSHPVKTFGRSGWKFGMTFNAGISGAGKGLPTMQLFAQRSDMNFSLPDVTPAPPASLYNRNAEPSQIENGISYGAGFIARKQLSKRFAFHTGIQYQYLSTRIKVGYRTNSLSSGNISGGYQGVYTPALLYDFTNKFHFISLPALFEYQVLKRKPLQLYGGISFRHLIATNALYFNPVYKLYYSDKNAFNNNQVFAELGISYSIPIKNISLSAGPHVQYSLGELEKDNASRHLVSAGLKAILLLQKK